MRRNVYRTTFVITALSAIERTLGFLYRIALARFIGAEGLGLYQVALSLFAVFLTIGTGGIPVTISRLKTKGYAEKRPQSGDEALSAGVIISLLTTVPVCVFFFLFGKRADFLFSDSRCNTLFNILLIGLPFTCVYADIRGSFWGDKKFFQPSLIELFEETVMVIAGILLLRGFSANGAEEITRGARLACVAVTISYFASFSVSVLLFFLNGGKIRSPKKQLKPLFSSAAPITAVRACSTLIGSAVAVILPAMLIKSGMTATEALRTFGSAAGMAMPVLSIPSTFIGSVSLVLTPEFSENFYRKRTEKLTADIEKGIFVSFAFSCLFIPSFFAFGLPVGRLLYSDESAGEMISRCAFLLLPMSVAMITTGILNSMNYEKQTLRFYFIGAAAMLLCVFFLPAVIGAYAYPVGMTLSFTCAACCNTFFLIDLYPLSKRLLCKCLTAFFLMIPVAACGKLIYAPLSRVLSVVPALLSAGILTLLFNAVLWLIFGIFPIKTLKRKLF